ncbi:hypothetical protein ALC53_08094 [Atta colombica]|uniref:Retroviral polymerase SH3-like domain-containing protein n=1 Tax=Atta colombica TaxID=520822 RepID=A0A151I2T4_9HYME|nr:hypothetical protein ALC53_08094 [Atta colombica]
MFFVVSDDLHSLASKELQYISKIVLLREFKNIWPPSDAQYLHSASAARFTADMLANKGKFDSRSRKGIFLDYVQYSKEYRVWMQFRGRSKSDRNLR